VSSNKTSCIQCNAEILKITSEIHEGKCAPCSQGRKKRKPLAKNPANKAQNKWEFFLALSAIIPFIIALILGSQLYSFLQIDLWNISDKWYGKEIKDILGKVLWVPIFYALISLYRVVLKTLKLLPPERAEKFPFGVRAESND